MKCILLVRVSTNKQNFDEQERELYNFAHKRYGYTDKDIVSVAEKESGLKLTEDERKGLNRMKELIESGEFDCVFAWEISRIARKRQILYNIVDYLQKKKVQLIIKDPFIELFNADFSLNNSGDLMFSLFAQLSEAEMRNKFARFQRAKNEYFEDGKYMGGKITLGYYVDENGYWRVDENGANVIRIIFDLYNTGNYSLTGLAEEMKTMGYFQNVKNITHIKAELSQILKNPIYIGERTSNNKYPRIIDDETWQKTVERRKANRHMGAQKAQRLLSALIRCECGASYSANLLDCAYCCRVRHNAVEKGLIHSPGINLNMAESLAWHVALSELEDEKISKQTIAKDEYEKQITVLERKVEALHTKIDDALRRREELDEHYFVYGRYTQERYEHLTSKSNEIIDEDNKAIQDYKSKIRQYKKLIEEETTFDDILNNLTQNYQELKQTTDVKLMRTIVQRYIKEVRVEFIDPTLPHYFFKKLTFITKDQNLMEERQKQMEALGLQDLGFINKHVYYVDTLQKKAFFDEQMTNEVPMFYMEREKRRRKEYRKKRNRKKKE